MNGKAPRRPRESKKEAVCLCSQGGMRKCPRSVSNLSEGGQATFSRRGKARQRRSSHRRAGLQLHRPIRGYMEEKGKQKERRKSQGEAWFWRPVSRVCLCPMTPPPPLPPPPLPPSSSYTPFPSTPPPTKLQWECVCVSFRKALLLLLLLPCLSVSAWTGAVWGMGVRACTVQLPVWPPHGGQGCVWCGTFYPRHECFLSILSDMPTLRHFIDNINQGKHRKCGYLCSILCHGMSLRR